LLQHSYHAKVIKLTLKKEVFFVCFCPEKRVSANGNESHGKKGSFADMMCIGLMFHGALSLSCFWHKLAHKH